MCETENKIAKVGQLMKPVDFVNEIMTRKYWTTKKC